MDKHNILNVETNVYKECGFCKSSKASEELRIPWEIYSQWLYLTMLHHNREWSAVFWVENNEVVRFEIPKQEVTAVSVEFKEDLGGNGIIHSHHSMGAFHSGQDDKRERNLYDYSIVIDSKMETVSCKKSKLPCGGFGYFDLDLLIIDMPELNVENITKKEYNNKINNNRFKESEYFMGYKPYNTKEDYMDTTPIEDWGDDEDDNDFPCDSCEEQDCLDCKHQDFFKEHEQLKEDEEISYE